MSLAPNVLAMVHASNDLAMLVPTEILSELTTHAMAKCISTYIKVSFIIPTRFVVVKSEILNLCQITHFNADTSVSRTL